MKVFLTGLPKSGKSTMLSDLIADLDPKRGLSSPEVRENGERVGFNLLDADGNTAILSRVGAPTDYPVGRYYVDIASLERFIEPLFNYADDQMLFIDEVGQMQLYSERFRELIKNYLQASNDFIGTVSQVYEHPLINDLKQNKDVLLCIVTPENRQQLKAALAEALNHRMMFNQLAKTKQNKTLGLARGHLASDQYISLRKLFKNAIPYIVGDKVSSKPGGFMVRGNTGSHNVGIINGNFVCDCDFFNGRGQFARNAGECSHIQAAKLFSS